MYFYLWFGLFLFRSPLLQKSLFIFSSYGYLDVSVPHVPLLCATLLTHRYMASFRHMSSLIRISTDWWIFAPPRSFSQLITSFVGSWYLGILPTLFVAWPLCNYPLRIASLNFSNFLFDVQMYYLIKNSSFASLYLRLISNCICFGFHC